MSELILKIRFSSEQISIKKKISKIRSKFFRKKITVNSEAIIKLIEQKSPNKRVGLYYPFGDEISTLELMDRLTKKKFIISLPEEKKNLLSEKNLKIIENQLRDFFSIRDLKIKIDTNFELSTSPINLKEESVKRNEEIVKEKIKKSDSYKKIVSELKPEIKKFDNSE